MTSDRRKHRRRSIRLKGYDYAQPDAYFVTTCTQGGEPLFGEVTSGRMCLNAAGEMVWRWWQRLNDKYPSLRTDAAIVMPNHFHGIIVIAGDPKSGQGQPNRAAPTDAAPDTTVGATPCGRPHTDVTPDTAAGPTSRGHPQTDLTPNTTVGAPSHGHPQPDVTPHTAVEATPRGRPQHITPDTTVGAPSHGHPQPDVTPDTTVGATPRGRPQGGHPDPNPDDRPPTLGQIVGWFKTMTTNEYTRGVKQLGWPPFPGKVWQRNYYEHIIRNREALDRIRAYVQTNPQQWALDRENPQRQGLDELESWIYDPPGRKAG